MYQVASLYIKEEVCTSLNEENFQIILNPRKAILYKELLWLICHFSFIVKIVGPNILGDDEISVNVGNFANSFMVKYCIFTDLSLTAMPFCSNSNLTYLCSFRKS